MQIASHASGASTVPLIGETIGRRFDRIAFEFPQGEAVVSVHQHARMTYAELRLATDTFAKGLMALGVEHGDRIGVWSTNNLEWVIAQFATAKIGAILVSLNPAYRTNDLRHALDQTGVSVLVFEARYKSSDYLGMVSKIQGDLPLLRRLVLIGDTRGTPLPAGATSWRDVMVRGEEISAEALEDRLARTQFDDPINIQFTSGTTGLPKGAVLSHHNILNNGFFVGEGCQYTHRDRVNIPVPFYHCFGMVLANTACMTHGATMVIPAPTFNAHATLQAVEQEKCTALYGVPTMFIAELSLPDFDRFDCSSLRTGIMAGSPCPVEIMKRVQTEMHMPEVTICYGMTETSPVSTQTSVDDSIEKRTTTVGRAHPHVELKVIGPDGRVVPRGTPGELCTRGYSVMLGYWNDPESTRAAIDAARWMHTGDLATMDEDGYVNIRGRLKDVVIRGGENISPREIEEFLYSHPAVKDVAVVGVPDRKYGEELCAWVVLKSNGTAPESEDLREYCRGKIAHYKIPRYVKFVTEFPMTVTGKVQKYRMREESIRELGLEGAAAIITA